MKTQTDVCQQFHKVFHGEPNFMTPVVLRREIAGNVGIELSTGDFLGDNIWGVTVLSDIHDTPKRESGAGGCFHSLEEAEAHIDNIKAQA